MPDTPYGDTCSVEELCQFANVQREAEPGWLPGEGELQPALDTRPFPVFIRVIEEPAVWDETELAEGRMVCLQEAKVRTYVLETEDIEVADNAVWLIVGDAPTHTEPEEVNHEEEGEGGPEEQNPGGE